MAYKCNPDHFFGLQKDSIAIQRYFRHVLAVENIPITAAYKQFQDMLDSYMKEHNISSEDSMPVVEWKKFSTLFARANKLEKNSPDITMDVENIIKRRHNSGIENLVLETKPKETTELESKSMSFIPALVGCIIYR